MLFNPLVVTFIAEWYLLHGCTMVCSSIQVGLFLKVSWALGFNLWVLALQRLSSYSSSVIHRVTLAFTSVSIKCG